MEKEFEIFEDTDNENSEKSELIEDLNKTIDFLESELSYIRAKNKDYTSLLKEQINFYKNTTCVLLAINVLLCYQLLKN